MLRDALDGLVVVDFTQMAAGPTCTMLLADMGADVVKVEPPEGDLGRALGPGWIGNDSSLFCAFNRNKKGIALDLKSPEGLAVARRLVARADVLVESMRPGVMERLGLGFADVSADNPRLIYCSVSAYGQSGPCRNNPGVDGILQADTGLMSLIGSPGSEPAKVQAPIVDVVTGYIACTGILAKLAQRARDGQGGHLDVNLMNCALALQQSALASYFADGELPTKMDSAAPYAAPNEAFQTSDGWVMIAAYNGNRWERLCVDVLGLPELADDERLATSPRRVTNRGLMRELLTAELRKHTTDHWLARLRNADILCARVATYADVERHPQVEANAMITAVSHPSYGTIRIPGFPINSAESNAVPHAAAPRLGEHSREVLRRFGYAAAEIESLVNQHVVVG